MGTVHIQQYMYIDVYVILCVYIYIVWRFPKMGGIPKLSMLIGCSIENQAAIGVTPMTMEPPV